MTITRIKQRDIECNRTSRLRRQSAFTTIEVLVASVLLALVASSLYSGITFGVGLIQTTRERLRGSQVLQEKLETLRLYNWSQINDHSFMPRAFTASLNPTGGAPFYQGSIAITAPSFTNEAYKSDMAQVNMKLSWKSLGVTNTLNLQTLVSRHGIQNYSF